MKNLFKICLMICAFVAGQSAFAQGGAFDPEKFKESLENASFREKLEAANLLIEDKLFYFAADVLIDLCKEQPDNANVNYKAGLCLLQVSNRRLEALPYLKAAEQSVSKKYNPFNIMEKNAPFETHYYLGKAYHLNNKIDLAEENYTKFLDDVSKKHILFNAANLELKHCAVARKELANPVGYKISNVEDIINNEYDDFAPVITPDESVMFFTSRRIRPDSSNAKIFSPQDGKHFEDIYVSYKDFKTGQWGEPEVLDKLCTPTSNQATISVSSDGQVLFFYKDVKGDGQIWFAEYNPMTETYDKPKKLGQGVSDINKDDAWETHVTISKDNDLIYFVSDREGGMGGRDIYVSRKLPTGQWSMAQNVGAPLNTPYDEDAPYFHPDGKTLFFSSTGEKSMGGFDIFYSTLQEDGTWSEPLNMGYELNSTDDDVFFMTNVSGDKGYFSGIHTDDSYGEKDIYVVNMAAKTSPFAILKGYIDPGAGKELPSGIVIYVTDLTEGGDPQEYTPNKRNGSYIFYLTPCHEYIIEYTLDDETFYETEMEIPCDADYTENEIVLSLDGVRIGGEEPVNPPASSDSLPEGDKSKWKYQLLVNGDPYMNDAFVEFMNDNQMIFKEFIDENGYFKYHELEGSVNPLKVINFDDPTLCDQLKLKLYDENGNVIRETTRDVRCKTSTVNIQPVEFKKYYGYNLSGLTSEEERWNNFVKGVEAIIEARGFVQIDLIGSASKVPTRTFKNNQNLAENRSSKAMKFLKDELKKKGIKDDQIKVVTLQSKVQGPKYQGDFKNTEKYGPYQYIEIKAK